MATARLTILLLAVLIVTASAVAVVGGLTPTQAIQSALSALAARDLDRADRIATDLIRSDQAGARRAWLIVAAARRRRGWFREAEAAYREFLAACPSAAEQRYVQERIRRCKLARTPRPTPVSRLLTKEQREALADVEARQYIESTEHFVVRAFNARLAKMVAEQAEVALARICESILSGQDYPHSVSIYVWPDIAEYGKHAVSAAEWSGGSFSLRHEGDRIARRIDLTQRDRAGRFNVIMLDRVLPHEMCHLVLAEFFGDAHCPLALNEGLAMMAEAEVDNSRVLLAGAALVNGGGILLEDLLLIERCPSDNVAVFYAEAFSLTCFLHSRLTRQQFREMLHHIKVGCPLDEAILRALYVPPDEPFLRHLAQAWKNEAIRQSQFLRAVGMAPTGT